MMRLGKFDEKKVSKIRPPLIELKGGETNNKIMESLEKLRNAYPKYKKLSIAHDMTKPDRVELKKLVAGALEKEKTQFMGNG